MTELKWHPDIHHPEVLLWEGREIARIENNSVEFMQFSTMMDQIPLGEYTDSNVPYRLLGIARKTLGLDDDETEGDKKPAELPADDLVQKIIRFCKKKGVHVHRYYSGRGMFGKLCIGFSGANGKCAAIAEFIKRKTGKHYCSDNMGLDMIYYFPGIEDKWEKS